MLLRHLLLFSWLTCEWADASERAVFASIFQSYERRIRPVRDENTQIVLNVMPIVVSLLEVNEEQEYVKLAIFINQRWKDEFLVWNPADFNGTNVIYVPASMVWLPDLTITTTSLEAEEIIKREDQLLEVSSNGDVYLSYPFVLSNKCPMVIDDYPFDSQRCNISMASWVYSDKYMSINSDSAFRQMDITSPEWEIGGLTNETIDRPIPLSNGDFSRTIQYTLPLKRKPAYYVWVIIAPTFIINALSIAGIFAPFNNEGGREEKVTLGLTTLLTLAVILSLVTGEMPRGTHLQLLGRFVLFEMCTCVISIVLSIIIMFLHHRATTRQWSVPNCLRKHLKYSQQDNNLMILKAGEVSSQEVMKANEHEQLRGLNHTLKQLNAAVSEVYKWLDHVKEDDIKKEQWRHVFDFTDLFFLILLEVVHAICYVIYFYR